MINLVRDQSVFFTWQSQFIFCTNHIFSFGKLTRSTSPIANGFYHSSLQMMDFLLNTLKHELCCQGLLAFIPWIWKSEREFFQCSTTRTFTLLLPITGCFVSELCHVNCLAPNKGNMKWLDIIISEWNIQTSPWKKGAIVFCCSNMISLFFLTRYVFTEAAWLSNFYIKHLGNENAVAQTIQHTK